MSDPYSDPYSDPSVPFVDFPDNPDFASDVANTKNGKIIKDMNIYLSIISIIGGLIVLLIIIFMYFYDKKLVNRVSLRLTAMISFVDVLSGLTAIAYVCYKPKESPECTSIAAGLSFFPQLYLFLTVMIAFNLQIVFLHRKKVSSFSDRWYVPAALFLALATNIPPLAYHRFGFDSDTLDCTYRNKFTNETSWWKLGTFLIPVATSMIYCTVVLAIVVCKLTFEHRQLAEAIQSNNSATLSQKKRKKKLLLLKLVSRIALYAAIPLLTVCGIVVEYVWENIHGSKDNDTPLPLVYWAVIGTCLPGFFNFVAFLFDPAIHNAFRKVKKNLIEKHGYKRSANTLKPTHTLSSPPMSPSESSPQNIFHSPPLPTNQPNVTHITVSPVSPTFPVSYSSQVSPSPGNITNLKKEKQTFLQWFVRTFLDKKVKTPMISVTSPSLTSLSTDQGHGYSTVTVNSGTISGQSFDHDYCRPELSSPRDKKRKSFLKRISREGGFNPINLGYTTSTTVTSGPSASTSYEDNSHLFLEQQHSFNNSGSFLFPPVLGNTTINIHIHQYPGSSMTHVETNVPPSLSGVSNASAFPPHPSHKRSDSESSTASRDSIDNDVSAY